MGEDQAWRDKRGSWAGPEFVAFSSDQPMLHKTCNGVNFSIAPAQPSFGPALALAAPNRARLPDGPARLRPIGNATTLTGAVIFHKAPS
jgi:hypothetical protein